MKKKKEPIIEHTSVNITPDYLYVEGLKFYKEAIEEEYKEKNKKVFDDVKEIYLKAILYLQAAMLLGSEDACAYLSEFYSSDNHLGINNKNISNLIKTIGVVTKFTKYINKTKSVCLKDFGITFDSELEELTFIEKGMIKTRKTEWDKVPVPKYLIESNVLSIIEGFNSKVLSKYKLITNTSVFECKEIVDTFAVLTDNTETPQTPEIPPTPEIIYDHESRSMKPNNDSMKDSVELIALGCIIS
ncbi:MAG: hypothetical protein RCO49_06120 [Rickettsia endosymbiont of Argas persicus]